MLKKCLILSSILFYSLSATETDFGNNMVVIHEYGSKKILAQGSLSGNRADSIDFSSKTVYDFKDFSGSIPDISEYMTTSIYMTGEGKLDSGGNHSPTFLNKFNVNNLLNYCSMPNKIDKCKELLKAINVDDMVYYTVRNKNYNNSVSDKVKWSAIKLELISMGGDTYTKNSVKSGINRIDKFLKIAWAVKPTYYEFYNSGAADIYLPMKIKPNNINEYSSIPSRNNVGGTDIKIVPYLYYGGVFNGNIGGTIIGDQLRIDKRVKERRCKRRLFRRKCYYDNYYISHSFIDLSNLGDDIEKYQYFTSAIRNGNNPVMSTYIDNLYVGGGRRAGTDTNRNDNEIVAGSMLIMSKSMSNALDRQKAYDIFKKESLNKIKDVLKDSLINSVKVYEINYGILPKFRKDSRGFNETSSGSKLIDTYIIENDFGSSEATSMYMLKSNYDFDINKVESIGRPKRKELAIHTQDSEGVFYETDGKNETKIDILPKKEFTLNTFISANGMVYGSNTIINGNNRYLLTEEGSNSSPDVELPILNNLNLFSEDNQNGGNSTRYGISGYRYTVPISCLLDNQCYMNTISDSNVYEGIDLHLRSGYIDDNDFPVKLNIIRSVQVPYTSSSQGVYQFLGPKYTEVIKHIGNYLDDTGQVKEYCAVEYSGIVGNVKFLTRNDKFVRVKQNIRDNFFYLERGNIDRSNSVRKTNAYKSVDMAIENENEEYSDDNSNQGKFKYVRFLDVGINGKCPDHSTTITNTRPEDFFYDRNNRNSLIHPMFLLSSAVPKYIDYYLSDDDFLNDLDNTYGHSVDVLNNKSDISTQNNRLKGELKSYLLNNFGSEEYLTAYGDSYRMNFRADDKNSLGAVPERFDDVWDTSNIEAYNNKRRDIARNITDKIMNSFYSKFDTDMDPKEDIKPILLEYNTIKEIDHRGENHYERVNINGKDELVLKSNSVFNECAKNAGWGINSSTGLKTSLCN